MFCFAGTCMSVLFLEAAGCWNPQETFSVWNAKRICDFSRFPPFCLFFLISPTSLWRQPFLAGDQKSLQSFWVLLLLRRWEPECWGQIFIHQSNMPATGCKLHSLLRACLAVTSSLNSFWKTHSRRILVNSCQHLPAECLVWYWEGNLQQKKEEHGFYGYRWTYHKAIFLSGLQPFLRDKKNRFPGLRRAVF